MPPRNSARAVVYTALIVCIYTGQSALAENSNAPALEYPQSLRKLSSSRVIAEKPEIIITEEVDTAASSSLPSPSPSGTEAPPPPPEDTGSNATSIAQKIDEALAKEFDEDTKQIASEAGKTFNETVQREEVRSTMAQ